MVQKNATGRPQKDIRVKIEADNYEKQVSDVNWPNPATAVTWRGGTPDAIVSDIAEGNEVCNITLIQAWDDPESLCVFMFEHAGEKAQISYKPHADSNFEITAEITLMRPTIGGKTNQFNEATIACPSTTPKVAVPGAGA
jgi:hypothetical protein